LVFDDGNFSENDTFTISDLLCQRASHTGYLHRSR
jgi:hypothetical protein